MTKSTDANNEAETKKGKAKADVKKSRKTKPTSSKTSKSSPTTTSTKEKPSSSQSNKSKSASQSSSQSSSQAKTTKTTKTKSKTTSEASKKVIPESTTVYKGKQVVIVESPNKIKKIKSLLEKIQDHPNFKECQFLVTASMGHIREIDHKRVGIDINNNFKPAYLVSDSKSHVVWDLKEMVRDANMIWLAADDDREGEAIAWHLMDVLKLSDSKYQRVTFNEITEKALREAFLHPRKIDMNRFHSQQARAVIDKLIGYLISPLLDAQFEAHGLSAGRVQSVAVDLVVQRELEIQKFESHGYFQVKGTFNPKTTDKDLKKLLVGGDLDKTFPDQKEAQAFLDLGNQAVFKILDITTTQTKRRPPPPLITSSLQQEASTKLGISPADTMKIAQRLYENGLITYMRTDSVMLSDDAKKQIKSQITKSFGEDYHKNTNYANKSDSQEAHEACRPSDFSKKSVLSHNGLSARDNKVYELIWKRAMASQMAPAECEIKTIKIGMDNSDHVFIAKAEKITYKGFLALYEKSKTTKTSKSSDSDKDDEEDESVPDDSEFYDSLKHLEIGQIMLYKLLEAAEKFSKPPKGRFTEASLIKELERLKIGRPSTYASIITKIQDKKRGYVSKLDKKGEKKDVHILQYQNGKFKINTTSITTGSAKQKLFPGQIGKSMTSFMKENFDKIMDYGFTANVETELDEIALGKHIWHHIVRNIYDQFNPQIEKIIQKHKNGEKGKIKRFLGTDPKTKSDISIIYNYWGAAICQDKGPNKEDKKYVSISDDEDLEITFEKALELLKYPICYSSNNNNSDDQITEKYELCKGVSNYYLKQVGSKKSSVSVNDDDLEKIEKMSFDEVKKYYNDHNTSGKDVVREVDKDIVIRKSRFGEGKYFISYKSKINIPIPAKVDYETLTRDQCAILINKKKEAMKKKKVPPKLIKRKQTSKPK